MLPPFSALVLLHSPRQNCSLFHVPIKPYSEPCYSPIILFYSICLHLDSPDGGLDRELPEDHAVFISVVLTLSSVLST